MGQLNKIYNNHDLNTLIEKQVILLLSRKIGSIPEPKIEYREIRKSVWLSSILAESKNEVHLKKVQDLAILLFLNNRDNIEVLKVVYILFSRIGNLAATKHLKSLIENRDTLEVDPFSEDAVLIKELTDKRINNSILINENSILLTEFQKSLFESLDKYPNLTISAPTSSGKSFILKRYIEQLFNVNNKFCVFYIVPSRALINQVTEELRSEILNVQIKNVYIENKELINEKIIYVITPERAVKIINSENILAKPDLIFIDEIQNIENEDGRGNLFEFVYEELVKLSEKVRIITAGPFIANSKDIFNELFEKEAKEVKTELSPVFQLRTIIRLNENSISITLFANNKAFYEINNAVTITNIENTFNGNIGKGLSILIKNLSKKDESNLVYCSKGNYAETWAIKFTESISIDKEIESELSDLIKYIKTEIHPKYFLIKCLEKRVAFHHSTISEFIRKEIESLFDQGVINTLFCTSTLLEGVNLPADNLFVVKPEKNKIELSDFEFGNLIGRAGRLKSTLFGTIYCVSRENNIEWAEKYYQANYNKEVKTSNSKALSQLRNEILDKPSQDISDSKTRNLVISLRNKALKKDGSIELYLDKHNNNNINDNPNIVNLINTSIEDIEISYKIIKKNPTIDPILQDILYKRILEEGIENWVIHPNSNFNTSFRREEAEKFSIKDTSFFWQLNQIIEKLDSIFEISNEIWKKDNITISPTVMCINALNWLQGKSLGELISRRIKYFAEDERVPPEKKIDPNNLSHVNKVIKDVIKINLKVTTFSLLKYIKLLIDILETLLTDSQKEKHKLTLALPIQIELGTQEPLVIALISIGIPRTISLKVHSAFKSQSESAQEDIIKWMKSQKEIVGIEPIYNKFLAKNNFLRTN